MHVVGVSGLPRLQMGHQKIRPEACTTIQVSGRLGYASTQTRADSSYCG